MSGYIAKDKPIGAGTWLVVGGVALTLGLLLFKGASAVASVLVVHAPGAQIKMSSGSTPQNLSALKSAFGPFVSDLGNGVYVVAVATDTTASVAGATVL